MTSDSMTDRFEVFQKRRPPRGEGLTVTLTQRGQLSISSAAFAELGSPKALELMYSRADSLIGIRAIDPSEPHAYAVRGRVVKNRHYGPYIISGTAFFRYFGIKVEQTRRYEAVMRDGILTIDLKKA